MPSYAARKIHQIETVIKTVDRNDPEKIAKAIDKPINMVKEMDPETIDYFLDKNKQKYQDILYYASPDVPNVSNVKNNIWSMIREVLKNIIKNQTETKTASVDEIIAMRDEIEFKIHSKKEELVTKINQQTANLYYLSTDQINTLFAQANDILLYEADKLREHYAQISISLVDALDQFLDNALLELGLYHKELLMPKRPNRQKKY